MQWRAGESIFVVATHGKELTTADTAKKGKEEENSISTSMH
jgi:hypothetical protein